MAAGSHGIPLASRIVKDYSIRPWQGTARANSCVFHNGKYRNWDDRFKKRTEGLWPTEDMVDVTATVCRIASG